MDNKDISILIVDDVPKNIQLLGNILRKEGYELEYATNGKDALDWAFSKSFDLILLDVMMPEMDGFEVCQKLKANSKTKEIPIIFLTAKSDVSDITRGFDEGGADYITKPFFAEELLARVKVHSAFFRQQRELKELNQTKDKFFSIIAHDLRNPINSILGFSGLLLRNYSKFSAEEIVTYLSFISEGVKKIHNLLENLLDWARVQTGKISFEPEKFDLKEICDEVVALFKETAVKKELEINTSIDSPIEVHADKQMISTVIRNLVSNSIKFSFPQGRIDISHRMIDENTVEVTVADTGTGIEAENLPKLFTLEHGFTSEGTQNEAGTGLGLILCKEFIEKNKGTIRAESEVGKGSKFILTLSLVPIQ